MKNIKDILNKTELSFNDIVALLSAVDNDRTLLFEKSAQVKRAEVSDFVYYRGLIEMSNICRKNCFYCGIRNDNKKVIPYTLTDDEIIDAVQFALESDYGSIVLQSGENISESFIKRIDLLIKKIHQMAGSDFGITLSLGEQNKETYQRWLDSGAHRYLLRIESSDAELYKKLHPNNSLHSFNQRLQCLQWLKETGYQVGTGIMVGLPFQTLDHLAKDILFIKDIDADMIGLGPYVEHSDTPLFAYKDLLMPASERFDLCLKVTAILRIVMKDINIAAATALQAIDKMGREKSIMIGANVIMPNITPVKYRSHYNLYEGKPCITDSPDDCSNCLEARIAITGNKIGYGVRGDSVHYLKRKKEI